MVAGCLWPRIDWWTLGAINDSDTDLLVRVELRDGTVAQMRFAAHSLDLMMTLDHPFSGSVSVIDPETCAVLKQVAVQSVGDNTVGIDPDGTIVTWRKDHRSDPPTTKLPPPNDECRP